MLLLKPVNTRRLVIKKEWSDNEDAGKIFQRWVQGHCWEQDQDGGELGSEGK